MRRKLRGFLIGLVTIAVASSAAEASFARRKPITIDPLQVTGPTDLTSFPVLVSLVDADLRTAPLGDVTSALGHDIVFRAEDAATCGGPATCLLAHEIETYDPATGTLVAFVRVPVLSTTNPTVLYMYYGDGSISCAQENPSGVWDSSFREVFHLDETGDYTDSTLNGYGAVTKGTVNQGVLGKVGRAAGFNGPTHSRLIASDGAMGPSASFTFEAWIFLDALQSGQFTGLVTKGRESGTHWAGLFKTGTNRISLGWQCCNPPTQPSNLNGPVLVAGQWYYAAATFDGVGKVRTLFLDGAQVATDNLADHAGFAQYLRIGDDSNGQYHDGTIDEVRVSDVVRSPDWIQTTYNNQNAPGTFYAVGAEDPAPPALNGTCVTEAPCQGIGSGACHYRSIGTRPDYGTAGPEGAGTTVSATTASTIVTGSGTAWIGANRGRGDRITIEGVDYTILSVDTETQLRLTSPFTGASGGGKTYTITRKFGTLASWESCLDGPASAACEGAFTADLVLDNRGEVGVVYNDGAPYTYSAVGTPVLNINGQTTDRTHTITLTVDPRNRHAGIAGSGVFVDNDANTTWAIAVQDEHVTVEWLRVSRGGAPGAHAFNVVAGALQNSIVLRNHLIHDVSGSGLRINSTDARVDFYNNIVYATGNRIVDVNQTLAAGSMVRLLNNTFFNPVGQGIRSAASENPLLLLRNNMIFDSSPGFNVGWIHVGSGNNLSDDTAPATLPPTFFISDTGHSPRGGGVYGASIASVSFVDTSVGSENLHIQNGSSAEDVAANLSFLYSIDVDGVARDALWDIGADEFASASHFRSIGTRPNYGTAAPEGAGTTVTATNGSATVSGSGTAWRAANRGRGDRVTIDGVDYTILSVDSETQLTLTSNFLGVSGSGKAYTIARKFATLPAWEDCIDGPGGAGCEGVATSSLVSDNRSEVGIAYDDSPFTASLLIDGSITDVTHTITLTADEGNRHYGVASGGVVLDNGANGSDGIGVQDDYVTIEWIEIKGGSGSADGVDVRGQAVQNLVLLRQLLVHDTASSGIQLEDADLIARLENNIVYEASSRGIVVTAGLNAAASIQMLNNTAYANGFHGLDGVGAGAFNMTLRNNLVIGNGSGDIFVPRFSAQSSHNISSDATAVAHSPAGGGVNNVPLASVRFVSTTPGLENLHIQNGSAAEGAGTSLLGFFTNDVDGETRDARWEVGADDITTVAHYRSIGTRANYGTAAPEGAGTTVTATSGSTLVTGSGTTWAASNRGRGDRITIDGVDYTILAVDSNTQIRLTGAFVGSTGSGKSYTIARKFATLAAWEDCIDGPGGLGCEGVSSASLVLDNRREVGIAYKDSIFTAGVTIEGSTTDALRYITLTADGTNRHYGLEAAGVDIDGGSSTAGEVLVQDDYTVVEWLEVSETVGGATTAGFRVNNAKNVVLQFLISQDNWNGIRVTGAGASSVTIRNSILYNNQNDGISGNTAAAGDTLVIENCTVFGHTQYGIDDKMSTLVIRNTISMNNLISDFSVGAITASNNISRDGSAPGTGSLPNRNHTANPTPPAGNWVIFVGTSVGNENFHLVNNPAENDAMNNGVNLSGSFTSDIDGGLRTAPWDIGADDVLATTSVELVRFEARGLDGAVDLLWETGSELDNLGFHVLRAVGASGSYERITPRLVPGLGSSPQGALYRYRDANVVNGRTYFYQLVDVETTGRETLHGPVFATPEAGEGDGDETETRIRYGDPEASGFEIVESDPWGATVELRTEGFYATPKDDGSVRIEVPGFEETDTGLPIERVWVTALAGRHVDVRSIEGLEVETFSSLVPSGERVEPEARRTGTVRLRRARGPRSQTETELARLADVAFQGETKKALVELAPISWDGARLVLVRHIRVKLSFARRDGQESPDGRRSRRAAAQAGDLLARLTTSSAGLHAVSFESIFGRGGALPTEELRLSRQNRSVPFHVEPRADRFGPGSTLYFLGAGPQANPYGNELVYSLERARGERMALDSAPPRSTPLTTYRHDERREENRLYQAGLLEAPDLWLWEVILSPETKAFPFDVSGLAPEAAASLRIALQGTSDSAAHPDHHIRLHLNGVLVGETSFDGKTPHELELRIPEGVLVDGRNELGVENTGDTEAPYSMVMLDRFEVSYSRRLSSAPSALVGRFEASGAAMVPVPGARVVDVTGAPRWLAGVESSPSGTRFAVEAGHRYAIASPDALARPRVSRPAARRISSARADLVAVGPQALLDAVRPLLAHRRAQGLVVREVTTEEIYDSFGFGEPSPLAIRDFLAHAYQQWARPSLRYVLLVGDGSYDFKDYLGTGASNDVPPLMVKTDYLWTASDPAFASVNGDDALPDVAIGRLSASSPAEARALAEKIVAFERRNLPLSRRSIVVADDVDRGGDFEANARELTDGILASRDSVPLLLGELGREETRARIVRELDSGAGTLSYIGHGGIHLWADETIFQTSDLGLLSPQADQPVALTMNCLNGYFHFPYFDSLAEGLVGASGKGAIAAISPSGLSLDGPAHRFHQALLGEILHGSHERLGDAILAAQRAYVESGAYPELLRIFHLFGDPALRLR